MEVSRSAMTQTTVPFHMTSSGPVDGVETALGYRRGAEYLLFLTRAAQRGHGQPNDLTPYWSALAPTNEQLFGDDDPWLVWVVQQIARTRGLVPGWTLARDALVVGDVRDLGSRSNDMPAAWPSRLPAWRWARRRQCSSLRFDRACRAAFGH